MEQQQHILIVEDEPEIGELIGLHLSQARYCTRRVESGEDALASIDLEEPSLVLLDLMLPGIDGLEVCRRLKWNDATRRIPVIMVTAKGEETDIVTGLELGADDYIVKPFRSSVLVARVRNVLRRTSAPSSHEEESSKRKVGDVVVDLDRHEVSANGNPVALTVTEFGILAFLMRRPGFVRTRDQIISEVHGDQVVLSRRTIDVHITALRRKLGGAGRMIETIRGVGYRLSQRADEG